LIILTSADRCLFLFIQIRKTLEFSPSESATLNQTVKPLLPTRHDFCGITEELEIVLGSIRVGRGVETGQGGTTGRFRVSPLGLKLGLGLVRRHTGARLIWSNRMERFSKLFMQLLQREFNLHQDPKVKAVISNQVGLSLNPSSFLLMSLSAYDFWGVLDGIV
jgi:hypothetical protein